MNEQGSKLLEGLEANKLTIEELEAVVGILEKCDPLTAVEITALTKMCWQIDTAYNPGDEQGGV